MAALVVLMVVLPVLGGAQTVPRDPVGTPVPCAWLDTTANVYVPCSDTRPMPTAAAAPVTAAQNPIGYGKSWVSVPVTLTAAVYLDDLRVLAVTGTGSIAGTVVRYEMRTSSDGGRSWSGAQFGIQGTATGLTGQQRRMVLIPSLGRLWWGGTSAGFSVSTESLANGQNSSGLFGAGALLAGTGDTQGAIAAEVQGTTLVVVGTANDAPQVAMSCRSTDGGVTFSGCVRLSPTAGTAIWGRTVATPGANTWLAIDSNGGVYRSTDNATSWSLVHTVPVGGVTTGGTTVACLSSTVCIATHRGSVARSLDAGATWTTTAGLDLSAGGAINFANALVDFGNGTVVLVARPDNAAIAGMRSEDFGSSWTPLPAVQGGGSTNIFTASTYAARAGRGLVVLSASTGSTSVRYNPTLLPGTVLPADATGALGAVAQGAPAGHTNRWPVGLSDGTTFISPATDRTLSNAPFATRLSDGTNFVGGSTVAPLAAGPVQGGTLFNSRQTGAADTAVVATITAAANQRAHLYRIDAWCDPAGTATIEVRDGATLIWSSLPGEVLAASIGRWWEDWPAAGLTGSVNTAMTVTLTTCGPGNSGTLTVQADRW